MVSVVSESLTRMQRVWAWKGARWASSCWGRAILRVWRHLERGQAKFHLARWIPLSHHFSSSFHTCDCLYAVVSIVLGFNLCFACSGRLCSLVLCGALFPSLLSNACHSCQWWLCFRTLLFPFSCLFHYFRLVLMTKALFIFLQYSSTSSSLVLSSLWFCTSSWLLRFQRLALVNFLSRQCHALTLKNFKCMQNHMQHWLSCDCSIWFFMWDFRQLDGIPLPQQLLCCPFTPPWL